MNALHEFDDDTSDKMDPLVETIKNICRSTRLSYSAEDQVQRAFLLGLWYQSFPVYMVGKLDPGYSWDLNSIDPEATKTYNKYPHLQKFQFVSEKGDSWHQVYRDLREKGWERRKVWREGGRLQYLMSMEEDPMLDLETNHNPVVSYSKPEGYRQIWLFLDISIATCKQVQVGTKMVEQPVYETQCEDLSPELADDEDRLAEKPMTIVVDPAVEGADQTAMFDPEQFLSEVEENAAAPTFAGYSETPIFDPENPPPEADSLAAYEVDRPRDPDDNEGLGGGLFDRITPVRDRDRQDDDMDQGESDPAGFFGDGPPDEDETHS